jgi:hypothetical protein
LVDNPKFEHYVGLKNYQRYLDERLSQPKRESPSPLPRSSPQLERNSPQGRQSPKLNHKDAASRAEETQSLEQALASNLLLRERTRVTNKLNPYNGKASQEIKPETLTFLMKNSGTAGPKEVSMNSTSKVGTRDLEDFDSSKIRYNMIDRSPKSKKQHMTI